MRTIFFDLISILFRDRNQLLKVPLIDVSS